MAGNIFDYLMWRGDITFSESAFNEVDNVILSTLIYTDFSKIVKDKGEKITVKDAAAAYSKLYGRREFDKSLPIAQNAPSLLFAMSETQRFKNVALRNFVKKTDKDVGIQFAAIGTDISKELSVIIFKGTDSTMVGWQEDFDMSYRIVPSQKEAKSYINSFILDDSKDESLKKPKNYIVCGHSKGGNLALYAAAMCKDEYKSRIKTIYTNDGLGFDREAPIWNKFPLIQKKITAIIPKESFVGVLYECPVKQTVIESQEKGFNEHNMFNWQVCGTKLIKEDDTTFYSKVLANAYKNWMSSLKLNDRAVLTITLFTMLYNSGMDDFSKLSEDMLNGTFNIIKNMKGIDKLDRKRTMKIIGDFLTEYKNSYIEIKKGR